MKILNSLRIPTTTGFIPAENNGEENETNTLSFITDTVIQHTKL